MIRKPLNSVRGFLGGIALGLGFIGLLLFAVTIPLTFFTANFWAGFGFREGPQPTPAHLEAVVDRELCRAVWDRLVPQLAISLALISYGLYEGFREGKERLLKGQK